MNVVLKIRNELFVILKGKVKSIFIQVMVVLNLMLDELGRFFDSASGGNALVSRSRRAIVIVASASSCIRCNARKFGMMVVGRKLLEDLHLFQDASTFLGFLRRFNLFGRSTAEKVASSRGVVGSDNRGFRMKIIDCKLLEIHRIRNETIVLFGLLRRQLLRSTEATKVATSIHCRVSDDRKLRVGILDGALLESRRIFQDTSTLLSFFHALRIQSRRTVEVVSSTGCVVGSNDTFLGVKVVNGKLLERHSFSHDTSTFLGFFHAFHILSGGTIEVVTGTRCFVGSNDRLLGMKVIGGKLLKSLQILHNEVALFVIVFSFGGRRTIKVETSTCSIVRGKD
mmetsp:Transcript_24754/g.44760  ORF Transcript_24754/g.44760 Transcript_24754/m.44760 type:complete len:340 (-) Transcript_24754:1007-2026(-)